MNYFHFEMFWSVYLLKLIWILIWFFHSFVKKIHFLNKQWNHTQKRKERWRRLCALWVVASNIGWLQWTITKFDESVLLEICEQITIRAKLKFLQDFLPSKNLFKYPFFVHCVVISSPFFAHSVRAILHCCLLQFCVCFVWCESFVYDVSI